MFAAVKSTAEWIRSCVVTSIYAEVSLEHYNDVIPCGEETLLCSITLKCAGKQFTNWHVDKTQITGLDGPKPDFRKRFKLRESGTVLDILCVADQPGCVVVKLDLGWRYKFVNETEFRLTVQSADPIVSVDQAGFADQTGPSDKINYADQTYYAGKSDSGDKIDYVNETEFRLTVQSADPIVSADQTGPSDKINSADQTYYAGKSDSDDKIDYAGKNDFANKSGCANESHLGTKLVSHLPSHAVWGRKTRSKPDETKPVVKEVSLVEKYNIDPAAQSNFDGKFLNQSDFINASQKADVSEDSPYVKCIPEFDALDEQPLFCDNDHFRCLIHLGHKIAVRSPSPQNIIVCYNKRRISADVKILHPGEWQADVSLENVNISGKGKAEFIFKLDGHFTLPLVLTFIVHQEFDEKSCKRISKGCQKGFLCENISSQKIKGDDLCNLHNIARVCSIDVGHLNVETCNSGVRLVLRELVDVEKVKKCYEILLHLIRGIYYREKALETDKEREKWKDKAIETHDCQKHKLASFCKEIKEKYAKHMETYNEKACEELFAFFNKGRGLNQVDLHGLLVADEEKLQKNEKELSERFSKKEVEDIITKRRKQGDEAIRKLVEKINKFTENMDQARRQHKTWLEVIVGAGHHSAGRQKIHPKVKKFLDKKYPGKVSVANQGSLVVTIEEYPFDGRCFGHYYCQECKNNWRSGNSYKNKWQGCYHCYQQNNSKINSKIMCFPLMQCPLKKGLQTNGREHIHVKELCQVCYEGGSCRS